MSRAAKTMISSLVPALVVGLPAGALPNFDRATGQLNAQVADGCHHKLLPFPSSTTVGTRRGSMQVERIVDAADGDIPHIVDIDGVFYTSFDHEGMNLYSEVTNNVSIGGVLAGNFTKGVAMNLSERWVTTYERFTLVANSTLGNSTSEEVCVTHTWPERDSLWHTSVAYGSLALVHVLAYTLATCISHDDSVDRFLVNASLPGSLGLDVPWSAHLFSEIDVDHSGIAQSQKTTFTFDKNSFRTTQSLTEDVNNARPGGPTRVERAPASWGACREESHQAFRSDLVWGSRHSHDVPVVSGLQALAMAALESVQRTSEQPNVIV